MKPYLANDVKLKNRKSVYSLISTKEILSRTDISNEMNISSPTVMKIMNYMQEKNIVIETQNVDLLKVGSSVGRKPQLYKFNKNLCSGIGIVLEGKYLRIGIVNLSGEIVERATMQCNSHFDSSINKVFEVSINKILDSANIPLERVVGIGIGIPGIYDEKNNAVLVAPLIGVSKPTSVAFVTDYLTDKFNVPVMLGNDVNMEVLGEYHSKKLSHDDMLYISLGTGVGAGIILDGKLRIGNTFNSGEIGYMAFLGDYIAGKDNPGWLESKINLEGLSKKFDFDVMDKNIGEDKIEEIIQYVSIPIALCINNITTVLDLKNITIGGILTERLGDRFVALVEEKVKQLCIFDVSVKSKVSIDAGIIGATIAIMDKYISAILSEE